LINILKAVIAYPKGNVVSCVMDTYSVVKCYNISDNLYNYININS